MCVVGLFCHSVVRPASIIKKIINPAFISEGMKKPLSCTFHNPKGHWLDPQALTTIMSVRRDNPKILISQVLGFFCSFQEREKHLFFLFSSMNSQQSSRFSPLMFYYQPTITPKDVIVGFCCRTFSRICRDFAAGPRLEEDSLSPAAVAAHRSFAFIHFS